MFPSQGVAERQKTLFEFGVVGVCLMVPKARVAKVNSLPRLCCTKWRRIENGSKGMTGTGSIGGQEAKARIKTVAKKNEGMRAGRARSYGKKV
jgi:hypothetical protein